MIPLQTTFTDNFVLAPGYGETRIHVGQRKAELIKAFSTGVQSYRFRGFLYLNMLGGAVEAVIDPESSLCVALHFRLKTDGPVPLRTTEGLHLGDDVEVLIRLYGRPDHIISKRYRGAGSVLAYRRGMRFFVDQYGVVTEITVVPPLLTFNN